MTDFLKHNCGLHRNVALLVLSVEIPSLGSVFVSSFISAEIRCNLGSPNEIHWLENITDSRLYSSVMTIVEFHCVKFNRFFHPNELPKRFSCKTTCQKLGIFSFQYQYFPNKNQPNYPVNHSCIRIANYKN